MKAKLFILGFLGLALMGSLFGETITQTKDIAAGTVTQVLTFDYFDSTFNISNSLTSVNVKLYTTVTGGDNGADNDADETVDVVVHLGAEFILNDRFHFEDNPLVPRLKSEIEESNIWNNITETTWDDELGLENGDGEVIDFTAPDGVYHSGLELNDTKQDNILSAVMTKFIGTGTFALDLLKDQENSIVTEGTAVAGAYNPVTIGGYVEITYTYIPTEDPVPVTLSSFTAAMNQGSQLLEWTTQSEDNSLGWHVYRNNEDNYDGSVRITDNIIEGAGFSSQPINYTLYDDDNLNVGETYWYFLENLEYNNSSNIVGRTSIMIEENDPLPVARDNFIGNYPNPFNPSTTIAYSVKESAAVKLTIYNLKGQKIIQLLNENRDSGEYNQIWNGRDSKGTSVGSGIYLAKLIIGDNIMSRKMLLMK